MKKYASRRFCLAVFFAITSTVALFTEFMTGALYSSIVATVLGIYGSAATYEKVKHNAMEKGD